MLINQIAKECLVSLELMKDVSFARKTNIDFIKAKNLLSNFCLA